MWLVAKIKSNQLEIFKKSLKDEIDGDIEFYYPKIMLENTYRYCKKGKFVNLLGSYIFCFNKDFKEKKLITLKYLKGLNYFLGTSVIYQDNIMGFINFCKSYENEDGTLNSNFFLNSQSKKFHFTNGPLNKLFFNILKVNKNKIIGELNNKTKIIIDKLNCYQFLNS